MNPNVTAEYVASIGWMYVIHTGRYGNFATEQAAIAAGRAHLALAAARTTSPPSAAPRSWRALRSGSPP